MNDQEPVEERSYKAAIIAAEAEPERWARKLNEILISKKKAEDRGHYNEARRLQKIMDGIEDSLTAQMRCRRCGRALEDPESLRLGIGPDCQRKVALQ